MRDPGTFTVDDPRFSTAQVVGPSMLSLDGEEHARHRDPFARPFRLDAVRERFATVVEEHVDALLDRIEPLGAADLRRRDRRPALGRGRWSPRSGSRRPTRPRRSRWYRDIVAEVTAITTGEEPDGSGREAFARLRASVEPALDRDPVSSLVAAAASDAGGLSREQVASNAAVLLFGGIETTEAMIANAFLHLLSDATNRGRPRATHGSSPRWWRSRSGSSLQRPSSTAMRPTGPSSAAPRSRRATS